MPISPRHRLRLPYPSAVTASPALGLLVALVILGCSGGAELLLPSDGEPASIEVEEGDRQSGRVGEPLIDSLVFVVTDSRSRPVEGARIVFDLTSSAPGMNVVPDTGRTDANGRAQVRLVLGTTIGPQTAEARVLVAEGATPPSTTFTATALPENANGIVAISGDEQSGPAGSVLSQPLVVQVTDAFGNPISGVPIVWTAEGGGSVSEPENVTDGDGRASVQRTLGPAAGPQSTLASSEGLAGSPVTFVHTATPGNASSLTLVSGNDQTAQVATRLPADLVVRLVDASGNGIPGAAVTWVVSTGGGSVTPENGTTDEAGQASAQWTLGPSPGPNRVDAVVSGVGVVTFQATAVAGSPASLAIIIQPSSSARNGQPLARQPVVQVRDNLGNSVATAGIVITAQLSGGGGELRGTRQRATDGSGRATFTDLAISGAEGNRVLVFTASGYAGASSNPIDVNAIGTNTTITSDSPDPSTVGQAVVVGFRVTADGVTPTGSVTVTDGSSSCTGTLSGGSGSCQLTLTTAGSRTLRATYAGAPGLNGSSDTESHQVSPPAPQNRGPDADYNWHCEGLTCDFTDRSTDSDGRITGWNWSFGDGISSTQQNPTHTYAAPGEYEVTLTVTDDDGATDQATAHPDVEAPPPPPPGETNTAITGDTPDPSDPGALVRVSWVVTASSGTPTGIVVVTDQRGGGCSGPAPSGSCDYTPGGTGTRTITATYQGSSSHRGSSGSAEHTVNEPPPPPPPPNQPPVAAFSWECDELKCDFDNDSSDPDGSIQSTSWNFGDGSTSTEFDPDHEYAGGGTYTVTLTVTDDDGTTGTVSHQVSVTAPNQPPNAAFTPPSCTAGQQCQFTDASTDSDGTVVAWEWDFDDSGAGSNQEDPVHTFQASGTYEVRLRVTDDDGESDEEKHDVVVAPAPNDPPTAVIGSITCTGMNCSFTDESTDPNGPETIAQWRWMFGDGQESNQRNPTHQYAAADNYTITLTVTDNRGATDDTQQAITVEGSAGGDDDDDDDEIERDLTAQRDLS